VEGDKSITPKAPHFCGAFYYLDKMLPTINMGQNEELYQDTFLYTCIMQYGMCSRR